MASQTRSAGLGANVDSGNADWTNPDNIYVSDDSDASVQLPETIVSDYLWATTFGFTIPAGATIDGIKVRIERQCNRESSIKDLTVELIKAGARVGDDKAKDTFWETTDTITSYGGAAAMWGQAWSVAQINAANFGIALSAENQWQALATTFARVDHIQITIYYTAPATNMKVNIGDEFKDVDSIKINIGDVWKDVIKIQINIGDVWKDIFG